MTDLSFAAQVDAWTKETRRRMLAVFHKSAEKVSERVVRKTPVDTGFLRASWAGSLNGIPTIRPGHRPSKDAKQGSYAYDSGPINLVIRSVPLGGTIYMGFAAEYAPHVEYGARGRAGRGMVRLAAQQWPRIVDEAIAEAKAAAAGR